MNLNLLLNKGVQSIARTASRFYMSNHRGLSCLTHMLPQLESSAHRRAKNEQQGLQTPVFLIASVASQCNLRCQGCYARAGGCCSENTMTMELSADEWSRIFMEAAGLGVSFILLAGGEPLTRRDVIQAAAAIPEVFFPIFTNGILLDEAYFSLLDEHRNLVPMLSLEGSAVETDARRGEGVAEKVDAAMLRLKERSILFGASVTMTKKNMESVLQDVFLSELQNQGCGVVIFVEYVPVEQGTEALVLGPAEQAYVQHRTNALKKSFRNMVILAFPGDEAAMGGCLASGRGFFHINPVGGAEPCPFSPHSVHNLREQSIQEVLESDYFRQMQTIAASADPHAGGCVLFAHEEEVAALVGKQS